MSGIEIRPIAGALGAEIHGVDLAAGHDKAHPVVRVEQSAQFRPSPGAGETFRVSVKSH